MELLLNVIKEVKTSDSVFGELKVSRYEAELKKLKTELTKQEGKRSELRVWRRVFDENMIRINAQLPVKDTENENRMFNHNEVDIQFEFDEHGEIGVREMGKRYLRVQNLSDKDLRVKVRLPLQKPFRPFAMRDVSEKEQARSGLDILFYMKKGDNNGNVYLDTNEIVFHIRPNGGYHLFDLDSVKFLDNIKDLQAKVLVGTEKDDTAWLNVLGAQLVGFLGQEQPRESLREHLNGGNAPMPSASGQSFSSTDVDHQWDFLPKPKLPHGDRSELRRLPEAVEAKEDFARQIEVDHVLGAIFEEEKTLNLSFANAIHEYFGAEIQNQAQTVASDLPAFYITEFDTSLLAGWKDQVLSERLSALSQKLPAKGRSIVLVSSESDLLRVAAIISAHSELQGLVEVKLGDISEETQARADKIGEIAQVIRVYPESRAAKDERLVDAAMLGAKNLLKPGQVLVFTPKDIVVSGHVVQLRSITLEELVEAWESAKAAAREIATKA
ncbi:MAG: hypothetical protein HY582_04310 [Candidatus Omnitrophica bacterium]|nr:hypothetical protein [Candidatus Omnitrophota bacterium]